MNSCANSIPRLSERPLFLWTFFVILLLFASGRPALAGSGAPAPLEPGDYRLTYSHDGRERSYRLHLPEAVKTEKPLPVVLVLHGGGTNARMTQRLAGMDDVADREGFVVVYPNGTGRFKRLLTWNAGTCCAYARENGVDDVSAIAALLDELPARFSVDARKVYATGMSNGAMMAYRLACELSGRIAAICPIAGTMNITECKPTRPVPVLHIHGTQDRNVPYKGGVGEKSISKVDYASVADSIRFWKQYNQCSGEPVTESLPDKHKDETTVQVQTWSACASGSEVTLYTIEGGGHTWPGTQKRLLHPLGHRSRDISAPEVMWEFFRRHTLPEVKSE